MINEQLLLKDDEEKRRKLKTVTMVLLRLLGVTKKRLFTADDLHSNT